MAVEEMHRLLSPGGVVLCTNPVVLQKYAPDPKDYWRFTRDSMEMLFSSFRKVSVHSFGNAATVSGSPFYLMTYHFPKSMVDSATMNFVLVWLQLPPGSELRSRNRGEPFLNHPTFRPWRIFVDHGEAYGNQGDEAMLLNALERLARYLGPCEFILPSEPGKPLPPQLPKVETILPPHMEFERWSRQFDKFLGLCQRLPLIRRLVREPIVPTVWKMAALWINVKINLWQWGILNSPGKCLQPFFEALKDCDVFYGVGSGRL